MADYDAEIVELEFFVSDSDEKEAEVIPGGFDEDE